jgi:predicted naringenin-chalcone synthase
MGCYAAIHAMKMADAICKTDERSKVMIVCTELCTLHFQREPTQDVIAASLLFGDGSAAALITHDSDLHLGMRIDGFYSEVMTRGKRDMSWELGSSGFLMTLSGYIPELIEADFSTLVDKALAVNGYERKDIGQWCIHPGGKRILEAISRSMQLEQGSLDACYDVLKQYGNMSSPTILFVLKQLMQQPRGKRTFGAAFGPGLTMETFVAS